MLSNINYLKGVVICHGKSEMCLVKYISTNLHLPIKVFSKDNGKSSIQITALKKLLNEPPFNSINSFLNQYTVQTTGKGIRQSLCNFKLFIIMDTDDCSEQQKDAYIDKSLFNGHWLFDYIVPIYNIVNLEDVMSRAGIMSRKIETGEKGKYYERIFPINSKPLSYYTLDEVKAFNEKVKKTKNTNLECLVDYCISLIEVIK